MSGFEVLSTLVSVLAALLALVALIRNRQNSTELTRIAKEQLAIQKVLASSQLRQVARDDELGNRAFVSASFQKGFGSSYSGIVIENHGPAAAFGVNLRFQLTPDQESPLLEEERLPMQELPPGQHVTLKAITTNRIYPPWNTELMWNDPDGTSHSEKCILDE